MAIDATGAPVNQQYQAMLQQSRAPDVGDVAMDVGTKIGTKVATKVGTEAATGALTNAFPETMGSLGGALEGVSGAASGLGGVAAGVPSFLAGDYNSGAGAMMGGAVGSLLLPGIGTAIGAILGGTAGKYLSPFALDKRHPNANATYGVDQATGNLIDPQGGSELYKTNYAQGQQENLQSFLSQYKKDHPDYDFTNKRLGVNYSPEQGGFSFYGDNGVAGNHYAYDSNNPDSIKAAQGQLGQYLDSQNGVAAGTNLAAHDAEAGSQSNSGQAAAAGGLISYKHIVRSGDLPQNRKDLSSADMQNGNYAQGGPTGDAPDDTKIAPAKSVLDHIYDLVSNMGRNHEAVRKQTSAGDYLNNSVVKKADGGPIDPSMGIQPDAGAPPPGVMQPPNANQANQDTADDVPAKLTDGEFVMDVDTVRYFGVAKLKKMQEQAQEALAQMRSGGAPAPEGPQQAPEKPPGLVPKPTGAPAPQAAPQGPPPIPMSPAPGPNGPTMAASGGMVMKYASGGVVKSPFDGGGQEKPPRFPGVVNQLNNLVYDEKTNGYANGGEVLGVKRNAALEEYLKDHPNSDARPPAYVAGSRG